MISVIVSTRDLQLIEQMKTSFNSQTTEELDWIITENPGTKSLAEVYNESIARARGDILVFSHDDVLMKTRNWNQLIQEVFRALPEAGIIGVAGTQILDRTGFWGNPRSPFLRGQLYQKHPRSILYHSFYPGQRDIEEVAALDGMFFAVRASLFKEGLQFDQDCFTGLHFYDIDICLQMRLNLNKKIYVINHLRILHLSEGRFDSVWNHYRKKMVEKYEKFLPVILPACTYYPLDRETEFYQMVKDL